MENYKWWEINTSVLLLIDHDENHQFYHNLWYCGLSLLPSATAQPVTLLSLTYTSGIAYLRCMAVVYQCRCKITQHGLWVQRWEKSIHSMNAFSTKPTSHTGLGIITWNDRLRRPIHSCMVSEPRMHVDCLNYHTLGAGRRRLTKPAFDWAPAIFLELQKHYRGLVSLKML